MFYLAWAYRNILKNRFRTGIIVLILSFVFVFLVLNYSFLNGASSQIVQTIRNYSGDLEINSKDESFDLSLLKKELIKLQIKSSIVEKCFVNNVSAVSTQSSQYCTVSGYSDNFYKLLKNQVSWSGYDFIKLKSNECVIEKSTADKLLLKQGDFVTLEYKNEDGCINTSSFEVNGVFYGNKYQHANQIFTNIESAKQLALSKINISRITITLDNFDKKTLTGIICILAKYSDHINTYIPSQSFTDDGFYNIFTSVNFFIKIIISLVSFVLILIMYFSIQNSFYHLFMSRSKEISVLATYGMSYRNVYMIVFWEAIICFCISIISGTVILFFLVKKISSINFQNISSEFITIFGGSHINFNFQITTILYILLFLILTVLVSSYLSLKKYFKLEVRSMIGGI